MNAFASGPDPARTGAPDELSCATGECHGATRFTNPARFRIITPLEYIPGQTYQIEIRHETTDLTRLRWGFQLTALTNANLRAGIFQSRNGQTEVVEDNRTGNIRQYIHQTLEGTFANQSGGTDWTVYWVAPATDIGIITFYAAGNQADNNNSNSGDQIFLAQAVCSPQQALPEPIISPLGTHPGTLLVYPLYISSATRRQTQNTRLSLTNTSETQAVTVRLFFVDGASGIANDAFVCLTPQQTFHLLASEFDPGITGYVIALACDALTGCPISFNELIGDASVKLATGHAANLAAETFHAKSAAFPCGQNDSKVTLRFDGVQLSQAPRALAIPVFGSAVDNLSVKLVLLRLGGDLSAPLTALGAGAGILYANANRFLAFTFTSSSAQWLVPFSNDFPLITPRLSEALPAGSYGWLKIWAREDVAWLGATLAPDHHTNGFSFGRRLQWLTLTDKASLTLTIEPPSC